MTTTPLTAGCSLLFVDGPPAQHRTLPYFDCTSSQLAPVTDLVLGGLEGIGSAVTLTDGTSPRDSSLVAPVAVAVAFLASGVYGFMRVSECKQAKAEMMMRAIDQSARAPWPMPRPPHGDPWLSPGPAQLAPWGAPAPAGGVAAPASAPAAPPLPTPGAPAPPSAPGP